MTRERELRRRGELDNRGESVTDCCCCCCCSECSVFEYLSLRRSVILKICIGFGISFLFRYAAALAEEERLVALHPAPINTSALPSQRLSTEAIFPLVSLT